MRVILAVLAVGAVSCVPVPVLVPGPHATVAPGGGDLAYAEVAGVRVWATGGWEGQPADLPQVVTPVKVTLENHSGYPVRIAYQDFTLLGGTGFRYAALPPFEISGVGEVVKEGELRPVDYHPAVPARPPPAMSPRFHHEHFRVAPPYLPFFVGLPLWAHAWAWSIAYNQVWYSRWPAQLPTKDMLQRALPEGVLENDGMLSGYIYFQHTGREGSVQLRIELQDAEGAGSPLGVASLPFVVRR